MTWDEDECWAPSYEPRASRQGTSGTDSQGLALSSAIAVGTPLLLRATMLVCWEDYVV
jgi:hypothetical protein